jgi:hypothetical protein
MNCAEVREALPAHVRDRGSSLSLRRHISSCSRCRAELARYESLLETLAAMPSATVEPPPGLYRSLAAIPAQPGRVQSAAGHVARNRKVYVGGLAVALAGAAGAAMWRSRGRRVLVA